MDATSASGTGFDAALKALEDLESDVAQARDSVSAPAAAPALGIAFSDVAEKSAQLHPEPAIAVVAVDPDPVAEAAVESAPVVEADPIEAATPAPAIAPVVSAPAKRSILPGLAVGLGLLSSAMAGAGLVVVSRTVNEAALVVADARERQAQASQVAHLLDEMKLLYARQLALLDRQQAAIAAAPLSAAELDARFALLKGERGKSDQSAQTLKTVHEGQNELNQTLTSIGMKVSRIEDKLGSAPAH